MNKYEVQNSTRFTQSPIIQITHDSSEQSLNNKQFEASKKDMTTTYDQATCQMSTSTSTATSASNQQQQQQQQQQLDEKGDDENQMKNLELLAGKSGSISGGSIKTKTKAKAKTKTKKKNNDGQTHAYKRRFFILALFCAHSAINSFQWIQYSSITDVITTYYGATNIQVNLTSLVYMITYIPFIIQASLMLERVGLRKAVVLGTLGTALGSLIKWWFGGSPGMGAFWWMMAGQTIVALSQLYIISIPPLLAAIWFPDNQVSTACGVGVFGNQLGIAIGFIIPPWVISDISASKEIIGRDLNNLACVVFWISFVICVISILALEDKPPKPPGSASLHAAHQHDADLLEHHHQQQQQQQQQQQTTTTTTTTDNNNNQQQIETHDSIRELCRDKDFRYLVLSYGINVGCFYAISTVLNQMVASRGPKEAGTMGLLIVVSGMAGSVMCGQLLDRTHAYKLIIVLIYLFSLLSMLLFTLVLRLFTQVVWPLYLASITLGFFMTGYLPLGFEFAAEITYPHPANTPAGLLNLFAQVFGLILTYASSVMVDELGDLWANTFLTVCLGIGLALTAVMKADLKRQKAVAEEQMKI